jgi:hypothetical protein
VSDRDVELLLDKLGIEVNAVVYLHSSFSRLRILETPPERILQKLMERVGPGGTLVLPSFAWNLNPQERPWAGYLRYFKERPIFDVRETPANIGAMPEAFRKMPGTRRSAHSCWSVCAMGALAEHVTAKQATIAHPYGPTSSFGLLARSHCLIVGLGVTLNTTSLTPVVDFALGPTHPQRVFTDQPEPCAVIDETGVRVDSTTFWLLPEVVRLIRPSVLFELSPKLMSVTRRADIVDTIIFSYPFDVYEAEAMALGRAAIARGEKVPWLASLPLRTESAVA